MKNVLILDAEQRSALAATRSLGKSKITVFTADEGETALAGSSRYSKQYFTYPSPRLDPELFTQRLVDLIIEQHIDIIIPMTELTSALLLSHKSSFPTTVIPMPEIETVNLLADKCSLMRAAEGMNIPIPETQYCDPSDNKLLNSLDLKFPVVLKPGMSWQCQNNHWYRAGVRVAYNPRELGDIVSSERAFQNHPYMLQEYIHGHGQAIFALYDHSTPVAFFAHRRLREKPPRGGVSVLSESIAIDPQLVEYARSILNSVNWHGVAMIEYKVANDGTPYLMEINTRFWGSLQLAINAGVDFPYLLYQLACNHKPDPVIDYKIGIRLRWLLGDLDSLYLVLRDKKYSVADKLLAVLKFLKPSPFRTRHEVNRWTDPGPAWYEFKQYIRDILD